MEDDRKTKIFFGQGSFAIGITKPAAKSIGYISLFFFLIIHISAALGQSIPLGQWESHFSYLSARHIVQANEHIFCSSYNGLFSVDINNGNNSILSKASGLSEVGVSSMAYDDKNRQLLLAYRSGNLDVVTLDEDSKPETINYWPAFENANDLPVDRKINQMIFYKEFAYLATNFGVVVLDTKLRQVQETYRYIGSNAAEVNVTAIAFSSDSIYALTNSGILVSSMQASVNRQYYVNWKVVETPHKTVAISSYQDKIYAGFEGKGIFSKSNNFWTSIYSGESQYYNFNSSNENLTATLDDKILLISPSGKIDAFTSPLLLSPKESLLTSGNAIWMADSKNGLIGNIEGDFKSFGPADTDTTISPRPDSIIVDLNGLSWTRLPGYLGGGVLVKSTQSNEQRLLTTTIGNGGLPSSFINSLAMDQDGYIWFASDRGVGYFIPDNILDGSRIDAVLPVYGQRRLFSNEKSTSLAIEPGNRKWIGTNSGLYLFTADGTELVSQFNSSDSPLPADQITALRFDSETGKLFIDTPKGMVSYQSNSLAASENLESVTIYPNPVRPGFGGEVGIKGLTSNSTVKITQLSGRLVYETKSQGGMASWNLRDYTGKRVSGGIYMIFIVSEKKTIRFVSKLAIIN